MRMGWGELEAEEGGVGRGGREGGRAQPWSSWWERPSTQYAGMEVCVYVKGGRESSARVQELCGLLLLGQVAAGGG